MTDIQGIRNLTIFTLLYLLAATAYALIGRNWEFVIYIAVVVILGIIALLLHRRVHFTPAVFWALSIWGLLHMIGGLVRLPPGFVYEGDKAVVYSWWIIPYLLKADNVIHAYGFAVATWICWHCLKAATGVNKPTIGLLTLCVFAGMGLGATNEIIEFITTLIVPSTNVGGYINTSWDLIWNLIGCLIAAILINTTYKNR
jgi:hypothetical protein